MIYIYITIFLIIIVIPVIMSVYTHKISLLFDSLAEIRERLSRCNNIEEFEIIEKEYRHILLNNKNYIIDNNIHEEIINIMKRKIIMENNNELEG